MRTCRNSFRKCRRLAARLARGFRYILIVLMLIPGSGFAQSPEQKNNKNIKTVTTVPGIVKQQIYTYYGVMIPKDSRIIEAKNPGDPNFLACDKSLLVVDLKRLKKTNRTCEFSPGDQPGIFTAYIKSVNPDGHLTLVTPVGTKGMSKKNIDELVAAFQGQKVSGELKAMKSLSAGDYLAITKSGKGGIAQICKLAPHKLAN